MNKNSYQPWQLGQFLPQPQPQSPLPRCRQYLTIATATAAIAIIATIASCILIINNLSISEYYKPTTKQPKQAPWYIQLRRETIATENVLCGGGVSTCGNRSSVQPRF